MIVRIKNVEYVKTKLLGLFRIKGQLFIARAARANG